MEPRKRSALAMILLVGVPMVLAIAATIAMNNDYYRDYSVVNKKLLSFRPIPFTDMLPGDWDNVCVINEHTRTSESLAPAFNTAPESFRIQPDDRKILESEWALAFVKGRTVQVLYMNNPDRPYPPQIPGDCAAYKGMGLKRSQQRPRELELIKI